MSTYVGINIFHWDKVMRTMTYGVFKYIEIIFASTKTYQVYVNQINQGVREIQIQFVRGAHGDSKPQFIKMPLFLQHKLMHFSIKPSSGSQKHITKL